MQEIHLIVPGALEQRTGGYVYDTRIVDGLRRLGWTVRVHSLEGAFPAADRRAAEALTSALESLEDGARVVIDGLAMGGLPGPVRDQGRRLRIVALVHHPLGEETGLSVEEAERFRRSERAALERCRGVIVTSPFTAGVMEEYGVDADRVRIVTPGTDAAPPAEGSEGPPVLLCVATLTPRKGHDVLVEALDAVRDLPWSCVCVGGVERAPAYAKSVRERVSRLGLDERITFAGERAGAGLEEIYRSASVFVLASHYEGYGMALTEALARGLPIVSTTGGAIPHTVPSDAAALVPPGDPQAFAAALRSVLEDGEYREALASAARARGADLPAWDSSAREFADAVTSLTE